MVNTNPAIDVTIEAVHVHYAGPLLDGHDSVSCRLDRIEAALIELKQLTKRDFNMSRAEAEKLDRITNAIKTRIEELIAEHVDDLTPEEQAEVDKDFETLDALGKKPIETIPDVPPVTNIPV